VSERVYVPVHRGDSFWAIEERLDGVVTHVCAAALSRIQAHALAEQFTRAVSLARREARPAVPSPPKEKVYETKPQRLGRSAAGVVYRGAGVSRR
jgi:hypothetical protein